MLKVEGLVAGYGSITVLKGIDLEVKPGQAVALIGANGAGKSTTLRALSGLIRPRSGRITFDGQDVTGLPAHKLSRAGLAHVFEGRAVLGQMSVYENLELGAYGRRDDEIASDLERIFERFPRLAERRRQPAGTLSGGEQQMLAIGRALMARPKLLLLDEPSMGLAPIVVAQVFALIREIREAGTTLLLVEQNARQALRIADHAYVLETGRIVAAGPAASLANDPQVIGAYLGGRAQ